MIFSLRNFGSPINSHHLRITCNSSDSKLIFLESHNTVTNNLKTCIEIYLYKILMLETSEISLLIITVVFLLNIVKVVVCASMVTSQRFVLKLEEGEEDAFAVRKVRQNLHDFYKLYMYIRAQN